MKDDSLEFLEVIQEIQIFLEPVFEAIVNKDKWEKSGNIWDVVGKRLDK